jgi:hypothetical protein
MKIRPLLTKIPRDVLWILLIVFLTNGQLFAQATGDSPEFPTTISIGAKVGASFNQFTQPGTMIGFNGGAFAKYTVTNFLNARIEVLYSQQGGGRQNYFDQLIPLLDPANVSSVTYVNPFVVFNNVEVPLIAEFGLPELSGGTIVPKFLVGGSYAFAVSAFEHHTKHYEFNDGSSVDFGYKKENVGSTYKQNQWSMMFGIGIDYNLGKRVFSTDIRYRQGLTQLNDFKFTGPQAGGKLYSSSLTFNFGMTIFNF